VLRTDPNLIPFYSEYSTPPVLSTMPGKTPFCCPKFSSWKRFTSDSWRLKYIKLHHAEHLEVAKNLTVCNTARRVEPAWLREFNANKDSVGDVDTFPYLGEVEIIAESESLTAPHPAQQTETYPGAGAPLSNHIDKPCEHDALGFLETNLKHNPYYPFATHEEYNYIQCVIKKQGMKTYYNNMLKEEYTTLHCPSFKNQDGIQKLVVSMQFDLALREWEPDTLEDMRWNENHQRPIKSWSQDIFEIMRWLMW